MMNLKIQKIIPFWKDGTASICKLIEKRCFVKKKLMFVQVVV
jgi:hypothetical protein